MKRLYSTLLLIFAAMAIAGFVFWRYFLQATIILDPVPSEATITVNGQPTAERTLHVPAGEYTVTVSADGFREKTESFRVGTGGRVIKRFELEILPRPAQALPGPISNLHLTANRQEIFFEQQGVLYSLPLSGQGAPAVPITPKLTDLERVAWSPDQSLAIVKKTNGETGLYDFKRYDLLSQEYRKFGDNIKSAAWSNDGNNIFRIEENGAGGRLFTRTNRAGGEAVVLSDISGLPVRHPVLLTVAGNYLVISNNNADGPSDLFAIDTHQKGVAPITDSGRATSPVLSPDKTRLAYLDNGELVSGTVLGQEKRNHAVRPKSGAYAFVDNSSLAVFTPNALTVVVLETGEKKVFDIYAPSDEINDLFISADGKTAYYVYQSALYSLNFRR